MAWQVYLCLQCKEPGSILHLDQLYMSHMSLLLKCVHHQCFGDVKFDLYTKTRALTPMSWGQCHTLIKTLAKQSHPTLAAASPAFGCQGGRVQGMRLPLDPCTLFPRGNIPNHEPPSAGTGQVSFPCPLLELSLHLRGGAAPLDQHCPSRQWCWGGAKPHREPKPGQQQWDTLVAGAGCAQEAAGTWHPTSTHAAQCPR